MLRGRSRSRSHRLIDRDASAADDRLVFIGLDDRGVELEVIAVQMPEYLLILPLMPYQYRSIR